MTRQSNSEVVSKEIILTLEGDLMEGGSIEYKTLSGVLENSIAAIEGFSKISGLNQIVTYRVKPPKEKCFEISLQAVQNVGAVALPLIQQAGTIKDVIGFFFEYIKIKKALKGEKINKENIITNKNGNVSIKNKEGVVVYNDNRNVINYTVINAASENPFINKKIDKLVTTVESDRQVDKISFSESENLENNLEILKEESPYFKYSETIEEKPDQLVGKIRYIDNKINKGIINVSEADKERGIDFELDINDISLLERTVNNLAIAEGTKSRVLFTGEKIFADGKIKKMIVRDVQLADGSFGF